MRKSREEKCRALVIPPDAEPWVDEGCTFKGIQAHAGGFVERVLMPLGCMGWVNDEARLRGSQHNFVATMLWRDAQAANRRFLDTQLLLGTAVVTGPVLGERELSNVDPELVGLAKGLWISQPGYRRDAMGLKEAQANRERYITVYEDLIRRELSHDQILMLANDVKETLITIASEKAVIELREEAR